MGFPRVLVPASSGPEPSRSAPSGGRRPAAPAVPGAHGPDGRAVPERSGALCANMRKPDGKIVLLGDMNVGKTSLLQRYMERRFADTVSTVGGAFYLKQWRSYHISIWDTAGEGASRAPSAPEPRGDRARAPALGSVPRAPVLQGRGPPRQGPQGRFPRAGVPGYLQGPLLPRQVTAFQGSGTVHVPTCCPLLVGKL